MANRFCAVPGAVSAALNGELPPLSVLSKRLTSSQDACAAAADAAGQQPQQTAAYLLASQGLASSQKERPDAVHKAFNEWTHSLTPALAGELQPQAGDRNNTTAAQNKGAAPRSWWDEQGPQIMRALLQEPDQQQQEQLAQQKTAPEGLTDAADPMLLLWDGANNPSYEPAADLSPAAAGQTGPAGAALSTQQQQQEQQQHEQPQQQHVSPFAAVPVPALGPGPAGPLGLTPTGLQLPVALAAANIVHVPPAGGGFQSPFANLGQAPTDMQPLHAPELLLSAYTLPAPGCSGGTCCSPTSSAAAAQAAAAMAGAQYQSPFTSVSPWDLAAAGAAAGSDSGFVGSLVAAAAAAVQAQAAVLAEAQGALLRAQRDALRQQRVRRSLGVRGDGRKMHSSTKVKLEIQQLQAQYEALLTKFQAEDSLNKTMRQRWTELNATYDAGVRQYLRRAAAPPAGFLAAAAAAAASARAAGGSPAAASAAAAAAAGLPVSLHDSDRLDSLAAAVQASWTDKLAQLADLLPVLERSCFGSTATCQQAADQAALVAPAGRQGLPASSSIPADDLLQSPFAAAAVAPARSAAAAAAPAAAAGASASPSHAPSQNAEAAALSTLSIPAAAAAFDTSMRLSDLPDDDAADDTARGEEEVSSLLDSSSSASVRSQHSLSISTGSGSFSGSGSHGVKRGRASATAAAGNLCADLSMLMSSNLSLALQQPCAKHARVEGNCSSNSLKLTESDMRLLFSAWSSEPAQLAGLVQQQQQGQRQGQQQLCGRQCSGAVASGGPGADPASVAAARLSAAVLCDSLWELFRNVALVGPSLMYRCFGPRVAYCPCCYSSQQYEQDRQQQQQGMLPSPGSGMFLAMLLEEDEGPAAAGQKPLLAGVCSACGQEGSAGAAGVDLAAAAAAVATAGGGAGQGAGTVLQALLRMPAQAVAASPAHWQRVKDSMCLSPGQEGAIRQLWAHLQDAHGPFADRQLQLCQALQQQFWSTGGWPGVACYSSCCAGEAAAAATEELLTDMSSSMAADCVICMETNNLLWGEASLLTLEQKAKCLVASYPFWPDYCLLECLAQAGATANTATAGPQA